MMCINLTLYLLTPQNGQTLKQFVSNLQWNYLGVFDHFVGLRLKGLSNCEKVYPLTPGVHQKVKAT